MRKKIFKPSKVGIATILVSATSFLSYAIGLFRDHIIANKFGTSAATDAYNASFLIPDLLFNLFIAGALSAAFLPVFSDQLTKNKKEAFRLAHTMLSSATLVISFLATVAFIFMPQIIPAAFPEAPPQLQTDIIGMTRLMLGSAIFFAISNTLGNILMSYKHFMSYAISPILYNLGIILGVIFLHEKIGIYSAATGVLIGAALHCSIRIIDSFSTEYRYKLQIDLKHPSFRKILKLMLPKSIGLISWQINLYIFALVGMQLAEGGFAAFNFARNIQSFAVSLFGIAFATAVFPYLTSSISKGDIKDYTQQLQKTVQRILFFTIPAMIGLMLLSTPVVELILGGGLFDSNSIQITSLILFFFAISIPFESLVHILARGFYAFQNTITPMVVQIISMLIIASSTYFIAPVYGIKWFSIGFSIAFIVQVMLLSILLSKKLQQFNFKLFLSSLGKTILSTTIMALSILLVQKLNIHLPVKLAALIYISIGAAIFLSTSHLLKSPELSSLQLIINKFKKAKQ